jgi:hypothetical protein
MEQYNQEPAPDSVVPGRIEFETASNKSIHSDSSHLYTLVNRLMETVERQARQISRLESTISEVKSTIRNRSQ